MEIDTNKLLTKKGLTRTEYLYLKVKTNRLQKIAQHTKNVGKNKNKFREDNNPIKPKVKVSMSKSSMEYLNKCYKGRITVRRKINGEWKKVTLLLNINGVGVLKKGDSVADLLLRNIARKAVNRIKKLPLYSNLE